MNRCLPISLMILLTLAPSFTAQAREICHGTCNLNVLQIADFHISPTAQKTLLEKGYRVIPVQEKEYVTKAKNQDLVLGFNTKVNVRKGKIYHTIEKWSSITLKEVISIDNELKYAILDTREDSSTTPATKGQGNQVIEKLQRDLHSCLAEYCGPLLDKLVQDLPPCKVK